MNKSILISSLMFLGFIQQGFSQQEKLNSNIKNESKLHLQDKNAPKRLTDVVGATYCHGTIDDTSIMKEINKLGITENKLKESIQCTAGDFDGNGYLDFAIWGLDTTNKNFDDVQWADGENFIVLFFDKSKIIQAKKIKTSPGSLLLHYAPRAKKGPHGEPITNKDALWISGQTDDYDDETKGKVYVFDAKSENFKIIKFGLN